MMPGGRNTRKRSGRGRGAVESGGKRLRSSKGTDEAVDLFVLRLNVPVNNFSVMSGWSHRFLGN